MAKRRREAKKIVAQAVEEVKSESEGSEQIDTQTRSKVIGNI